MLNRIVLAALVPAIMAKPIAQPSEQTATNAARATTGSVIYHDNAPRVIANIADYNTTGMIDAAVESHKAGMANNDEPVPRINDPVMRATRTRMANHQHTRPTAINAVPHVVERQIAFNSTKASSLFGNPHPGSSSANWAASSAAAVAYASDLANAIAEDLALFPPQKREPTVTPTSSMRPSTSGSPTHSSAKPARTFASCDCISECADEDGKATQMMCMEDCSKSCDGDDDGKNNNLFTSLQTTLNQTLGLRDITPITHTHVHEPKPVHEVAAGEEEDYEACMNSCKTHNCQHSEVGISLSQCGDTSCEDACAKHKKGGADKVIYKKHVEPVPHRTAKTHPPPKAVAPVEAGAKGDEEYEACMSKCSTHNCQNSQVGIDISQCGDTSCADSCAQYKKTKSMEAHTANVFDKKNVVPVANHVPQSRKPVPAKAHAHAHAPAVEGAAHSEEDYEACVSKCKTHNCQHSEVSIRLSQCGDTSCHDSCAKKHKSGAAQIHSGPKNPAHAPAHAPVHARGRVGDDVKAEAKGVKPVAAGGHKEDYQSCMSKCSTHNCQHSEVGIDISQCGKTSCEDDCAKYKNEGEFEVDVKKEHPPPDPHLNIPVDAPIPGPHSRTKANTGNVPAVAAVPEVPPVRDLPSTEAHKSTEYDNCMQKCKTHNCQKADIGLEVSQCGDTTCESACVQYKADAGGHVGPRA
ncbi:uncharacterized protein F4822DRAFT_425169 [Hypoxylon trugodes]|uniref:uncharacterized protein n=1 Tax=Hypoxylon trugodes TaxID=326681 RepID=UPI002199360F|nr:uncharacterized protein F4822DRAFT_425169 [Hypoxylon trugodes]KAI1391951.1 hypothetical protein F4822DRAFT_425169 [Hypoxylon trugodes]